jgi:penicillin-binding protein 1C
MGSEDQAQRTLWRKLRESVLALRLNVQRTKEQVLALYLNQTYYGNMAIGAAAAAQTYFGKPVQELDLAECALLAGLPQSPATHDPFTSPENARERQQVVLRLMVRQGYITEAQAKAAAEESLHYGSGEFEIRAPHFVMLVQRLLEQRLGYERVMKGGLRIYTSLDLDLQEAAEASVRRHLAQLNDASDGEPGHNVHNAGLVAMDPQTGEVLAMVGSPDYFDASIDGAVNAALSLRQPGSAIKPVTYATAFAQDYTPATMIVDTREAFVTKEGEPYVPQNYDLAYHGPVLLRDALASSYNLVAVKVLQHVGIPDMVSTARRLGLTTLENAERYGLALTLGGGEVSLLELTAAYGAFAKAGRTVTPIPLLRIEDANGRLVRAYEPLAGEQAISPQVAYLITDILSDDSARRPTFGEGSVLALSRPAAVKTGTTTDFRDNWTLGYAPGLVVGVWTGNADNSPMRDVSGVSGAAPIWHEVMEEALRGTPVLSFEQPEGLVRVEVCADSGLLPNKDCPGRRSELFIEGTEPTKICDWHRRIRVDRRTGQLATENCPAEYVEERVALYWPAEAMDWARETGRALPPTETCSLDPETSGAASIAQGASSTSLVLVGPDPKGVYRISTTMPRDAQGLVLAARVEGVAQMAEVTFLVDGRTVGVSSRTPYQVVWRLQPGEHTLQAVATTTSGTKASSEVWQFTVLE